jgi:hypothetical protein
MEIWIYIEICHYTNEFGPPIESLLVGHLDVYCKDRGMGISKDLLLQQYKLIWHNVMKQH